MYHMFICCVFSIFAVTAAAAADAADRTEKLPLLGVVLLKRNHHTKNQPDPIINVATAPFLGFWVPRPQMCHKITPPLKNIFKKIIFKFYHREKRQFRRLSDWLCNTVENEWMSKVFSVSKY